MTTVTDQTFRAAMLQTVALGDDLPPGVIGRVQGIALVYDVVDEHGTVFARGCLARTVRERVAGGKVRLFFDHGGAPVTGMYDSSMHVGTVRSLHDVELGDGTHGAQMLAELFDTSAGRACYEYLKAVEATGGETGLSVGFVPKGMKSRRVMVGGDMREQFTEVPLREISITSISSIPGTAVTAVRSASLDYAPLARGIHAALGGDTFRALVREILGDAEAPTDSDAGPPPDSDAAPQDSPQTGDPVAIPPAVPYEARLAFARSAYH